MKGIEYLQIENRVGTLRVENPALFQHVFSLLQQGKQVIFYIKGNSMYPFLQNNKDKVLIKSVSYKKLNPGDIVLFRYGDHYILHRLIRKEKDFFVMRGDNCKLTQCETVHSSNILGVVKRVVRQNNTYIDSTSNIFRFYSFCLIKFPLFSRKLLHYIPVKD